MNSLDRAPSLRESPAPWLTRKLQYWRWRLVRWIDRDITERAYECELNGEVVNYVRQAAQRVTGGNCGFADDDLHILEHLATRAADAGLTDGLAPDVRLKTERLASARNDGARTQNQDNPDV